MGYAEALRYLEGLGRFGLRPGLERVRAMATRLGDPQTGLRFVHVAGTNGKGSTCAFLDAMFREAGLRTGLYTSPHLASFRERIRVDGEWIPETAVADGMERVRVAAELAAPESEALPTFFEQTTILALDWFSRRGCDVVVWETGLGGRLDATNIVTPTVSAITNIGRDHMEWLGPTLEAIAREKAGIFKPGVPAVTTESRPEILEVLRVAAALRGTELGVVPPEGTDPIEEADVVHPGMALGLRGPHQIRNARLAWAALEAGGWRDRVDVEARLRGLAKVRWPGRFQVVERGRQTLVLDGAHNAPGFEVLREAMAKEFPGVRFALLVGMLADKEPGEGLHALAGGASRIVVTSVESARAGDPINLRSLLASWYPECPIEVLPGVAASLDRVAEENLVVVTGSLYLIGEALQRLALGTENERRLNDWGRIP